MRYGLGKAIGLAVVLAASPGLAAEPMSLDLTYDSVMDMVRPEYLPDLHVHHRLHVETDANGMLTERRNRSINAYSDRNATDQALGDPEDAAGVSWQAATDGTFLRNQDFPQSTRTMTVTLLPGRTCRLDIVDRLKPGFTEYQFRRIKVRQWAFYRNYVVTGTTCTIR